MFTVIEMHVVFDLYSNCLVLPVFLCLLCAFVSLLSSPHPGLLSSILISPHLFSCLHLSQDHPAQCHLPTERTQHIFPSQRGRVRHVPQMEGQQGQGPRIH